MLTLALGPFFGVLLLLHAGCASCNQGGVCVRVPAVVAFRALQNSLQRSCLLSALVTPFFFKLQPAAWLWCCAAREGAAWCGWPGICRPTQQLRGGHLCYARRCSHVYVNRARAAAQLCCTCRQRACLVVCAACGLCLLAPLLLHPFQQPASGKSDSPCGPSFFAAAAVPMFCWMPRLAVCGV